MDLKLSTQGDLELTSNDFTTVTDEAAIAQHARLRMLTVKGEWFLDARVGLPYREEILIRAPDLRRVEDLYRRTLADTPGISSVPDVNVSLNGSTRELTLTARAVTNTGLTLTFRELIV